MLLSLVQIRADVLKIKKLLIEDFIGVMNLKVFTLLVRRVKTGILEDCRK